MKKIYIALLTMATALATMTGCKTEEPYFTAGEDDFPRILNTDIEEAKGGKPCALANISRDANFNLEIKVTPTAYTTVSWYFDGVKLYEGNTIDMPLLAGDYNIKIVAATTQGKETFRNCTLKVLPLDTDPALSQDAKSRWLNPGAAASIEGSNISNITGLEIKMDPAGETKADDPYTYVPVEEFSNSGSKITYKVPSTLPLGEYPLIAVDNTGFKFGCGTVTVSDEKYVEPGKVEKAIWEGATDIDWGASNVTITPEQLADIPVGTEITLTYRMVDMPDGYHALRVTTPSWGDNPAVDDLVPQVDGLADAAPESYTFVYDQKCKDLVESRGGMLIVGYGFKLTKVSYMAESGAAVEKSLWEGATDIDWGASNVTITPEQLADVPVGTEITLTYRMVDMPDGYHALRVTTPSWGDNPAVDDLVPQVDGLADAAPESYTFVYDQKCKDLVESRGGMLIVGYGFKLTKVSYMAKGAAEKEVWKGTVDIDWGASNVTITPEQLADVNVGSKVTLTYEMVDMPDGYHALRVTTPSWGDNPAVDDLVPQVDGLAEAAPESYTFEYDQKCKDLVESRGGMLIVGYGFKLTRVTVQ